MSFLIYFVVLVVTSLSVLFGLDFLTAPLPTMPNVPIGRQAHLAPLKPETPAAKRADARALTPIYPAVPGGEQTKTATTGADAASPARPDGAQTAAAQPGQNKCDVQACAIAYRSFRASDCTYRPYDGPRRLCDQTNASVAAAQHAQQAQAAPAKPAPAPQSASPDADASSAGIADASPEVASIVRAFGPYAHDVEVQEADGRVVTVHAGNAQDEAPCNVAACAAAYSSFNAADCTYRPHGGPRQLCTK